MQLFKMLHMRRKAMKSTTSVPWMRWWIRWMKDPLFLWFLRSMMNMSWWDKRWWKKWTHQSSSPRLRWKESENGFEHLEKFVLPYVGYITWLAMEAIRLCSNFWGQLVLQQSLVKRQGILPVRPVASVNKYNDHLWFDRPTNWSSTMRCRWIALRWKIRQGTATLSCRWFVWASFFIKLGGCQLEEFPRAAFAQRPCWLDGFNLLELLKWWLVIVEFTIKEEWRIFYGSMASNFAMLEWKRLFR